MKAWKNGFGLVCVSLLAIAAAGCGSTDEPKQEEEEMMGTQLTGAAAYTVLSAADAMPGAAPAPAKYTSVCLACHQANGQGFTLLAPEIRHTPAAYAQWIIRNGRAGTSMIAYPATSTEPNVQTLTDAEVTEIITWLEGLPKPTTGQGLYQDFCGNCHGPMNPTGGAVPVSIVGRPIAEVTQNVRSGVGLDPAARTAYMPAEPVTSLTDAELGLIQQYIMAK